MLRLIFCFVLAFPDIAFAYETRCGWYENPSPANHWLEDDTGLWPLSTRGGPLPAEGFYDLPAESFEFGEEWVSAASPFNNYYGYGCACIRGVFDTTGHRVLLITKLEPIPLNRCRTDPNLPPEPSYYE